MEGRCESGVLRVAIVRDTGRVVRDDDVLVVVTSDFIATASDGFLSPLGTVKYTDAPGPTMRDAMVEALRKRGGSLRGDELLNPNSPRIVYPADLPARCAA